jgi:hypothetical protein
LSFLAFHWDTAPAHAREHPIHFDGEALDLLALPLLSRITAGLPGLRLHALDLPIFELGERFAYRAHQAQGLPGRHPQRHMPAQALGGFLKRQATTQVADLALHPAGRPSLVQAPDDVIGRFPVRTARLGIIHRQTLVIRADKRDWPQQAEEFLRTLSNQPLTMAAPALASGFGALLTELAVEHAFQQAPSHPLARLDSLFFQVFQVPFAQVLHLHEKPF